METTYKVAVSHLALDHKLAPGSSEWPALNSSFENRELEPFELAAAIYDGHPFTTWHANNWRATQNYICGQHVALDFDSGDQSSTLTELAQNPFISTYASILYTTPSHTPQTPRARVVFLLDTPIHQAKNYALTAQALLWMHGTADRQCKDPVRFFYGSLRCDMEIPSNILPLSVVQRVIKRFLETGQQERRKFQRAIVGQNADQQEIADALKKIPAWGIDYDEWVQVLMALHRELGDAGFALAEAWAEGLPNEVARKWRSFRSDGNGTGVVGIGTVFALAKRFGWERNTK